MHPGTTVAADAPGSAEAGLAHIRDVLAQIQDRLQRSSAGMPDAGSARQSEQLGVPAPPPMDDEEMERAEQITREAVEDRAGEANLRGPFER